MIDDWRSEAVHLNLCPHFDLDGSDPQGGGAQYLIGGAGYWNGVLLLYQSPLLYGIQ